MDLPRKNIAIIATIVMTLSLLLFTTLNGFKGFGSTAPEVPGDSLYFNKPFRLPDELSFAGERVPLENFDTRESLEREIIVSAYRHSSTILIIKRAARYLPVIEPILKKNGIPDDFKFLVAAESEYSNMISPAGATGFWQIMQATGREYGLEINSVVDERYHLEKSTQLACDFLRKTYEKYGSWTMSAASYNCGRSGLDTQVSIQKKNNYYDLLLNEETARYIFRVVEYKLIINDPPCYGFDIKENELYPELKYHEVKVDSEVADFSDFAAGHGTNYKLLKLYNPWLRRPYLTPRQGKIYLIKIPAAGLRNPESIKSSGRIYQDSQ